MAVIKGGFEIVKRAMLKELMKRGDDGIMLTLPKNELVDLNARITMDRLIKAGIDPESLTSPDQVLNVLENINNQMMKNARVIPGSSAEGKAITEKLFGKKGEVVEFPQKRTFKEEIEAMKKSGDIVDVEDVKISEKITDRDMFKNSNLNKRDSVTETISYIKTLEPMDAMKEANSVIGRKGRYKNLTPEESKKILQDTEDHIFERDIPIDPEDMARGGRAGFSAGGGSDRMPTDYEKFLMQKKLREMQDFQNYMKNKDIEKHKHKFFEMNSGTGPGPILEAAKGGRAGFYTGGITDVEPNLSDIGHGSDSLMARTRLMSPGSQATTSTGLNYLLAEDNDNLRVPFKVGGDAGRRAFLKLLATLTGGVAAAKTGILGLGEGVGKKAVTESVKQAAGSGTPPPYFFKLVEKIKTMGDDVTEVLAYKDRQKVTKFKDYELTEDLTTGEQTIQRMKVLDDGSEAYYGKPLTEETYMSYKPGKGQIDETTKGKTPPDEYEEGTALLRNDKEYAGEVVDESATISDEVVQEGTMFEDNMTEFGKADGGRIGFSAGNLAKLGINSTSRKFLEKVFGKERFATMVENDPRMEQGMLEVVDMFRKKDKEGLKMYLQKFLPHMDDEMVEDFIVGSGDSSGIRGQLIRLGSGREYKSLMDLSKQADNVRKLDKLDVTEEMIRKPNSNGGRIGFSGGGIFRAIIAKSAAKKGLKPYEFIKVTNYKGLPPEVRMFISPEEYAQLKLGQEQMYTNFIDMAKTRKEFQKNIEGGKTTPARELFEGMEKTMDEQSFVPKTVTADDIAEMELMVKNRFNKGRKDNAQGGLQTMLGE